MYTSGPTRPFGSLPRFFPQGFKLCPPAPSLLPLIITETALGISPGVGGFSIWLHFSLHLWCSKSGPGHTGPHSGCIVEDYRMTEGCRKGQEALLPSSHSLSPLLLPSCCILSSALARLSCLLPIGAQARPSGWDHTLLSLSERTVPTKNPVFPMSWSCTWGILLPISSLMTMCNRFMFCFDCLVCTSGHGHNCVPPAQIEFW